MRRALVFTVVTVLAAGGIAACNLVGGPACPGSQCVQEDDGEEWEIDVDGHRRKKLTPPKAVVPVKPIAPVKPVVPARPPKAGK